jgi:hypothetical protein
MTAKQAIKARCLDCAGHKCADTKCPIFGLMKPKAGVNRIEAIRQYCQWCMNGTPVNLCASPGCSIYQYRAAAQGNIGVSFLPIIPSKNNVDDNGNELKEKIGVNGGVETGLPRNVNSEDLRRAV